MRQTLIALALPLCLAVRTVTGQGVIPVTTAQAQGEAAAYSRSDTASTSQPFFSRPFAGTSDRRCVAAAAADDWRASGSLRSGEMIVRGRWNDPAALRAGVSNKFLWLPLHGSGNMKAPLLVRADRIGAAADSLRLAVTHLVRGGGHMYGYPSLVSFPTAGRRLVVATAGSDWGCFVIDISKSGASTR